MNEAKGNDENRADPKGVTRITASDGDPIASALRQLYDNAAQEPLPDELSKLLDRLDAAEKNR